MKYFKYIIAIIIYAALMLCTIFVPQTTSPALGSEIVYDIAMIGVAIAIAVTMSKFEPGSNNHIFWRDLFVAIMIFVVLRITKVYICGLLFGMDPGILQYFNLGYLISGVLLCIALYKSIRLYTLKLKPIHIFAIVVSGLVTLGSIAALLLSGLLGNNQASIVTVVSSAALSLVGVIMIILAVMLIIKTMGGMIQNVLIMIAAGFVCLIAHQTFYIMDKLHGLANAAISPITEIPYFLFCIFCLISCFMRIDIAAKENEAINTIMEN